MTKIGPDGRKLAYAICISIACAYCAFMLFVTHVRDSPSDSGHADETDNDQSAPSARSTKNNSRYEEFSDCNQDDAKDLDPLWIIFTDSRLEYRFVRLTSENTFSYLVVPMAFLCTYIISELFFDAGWRFRPTLHMWNHEAPIVLNVSSLTMIASCYCICRNFSNVSAVQDSATPKKSVSATIPDKLLVCAVSWIVSLLLLFGTRTRVCAFFCVSEREVFGSSYDDAHLASHDELSITQTIAFTCIVFSKLSMFPCAFTICSISDSFLPCCIPCR